MTPLALPSRCLDTPFATAALVAVGGSLTILGAWYFQYVLKYEPCQMCLEQRIPYYVVIPLAVVIAIGALAHLPPRLLAAGLMLSALIMLGCSIFAAYHAGVEWKLWAGPAGCSGGSTDFGSAADLLKDLETTHIPSCDSAAVRIFGISLAGWNALIALALAAIACIGARRAWRDAGVRPV